MATNDVDITIHTHEFEDPADARQARVRVETAAYAWTDEVVLSIAIPPQNGYNGEMVMVALSLVELGALREALDAANEHLRSHTNVDSPPGRE